MTVPFTSIRCADYLETPRIVTFVHRISRRFLYGSKQVPLHVRSSRKILDNHHHHLSITMRVNYRVRLFEPSLVFPTEVPEY